MAPFLVTIACLDGFSSMPHEARSLPECCGACNVGIIGALSNNSIGLAGVAGGRNGQPGVSMMHLKVFSGITRPGSTRSRLQMGFEEALVYAADMGAAIACNAWRRLSAGAQHCSGQYFNATHVKHFTVLLLAQLSFMRQHHARFSAYGQVRSLIEVLIPSFAAPIA
eukprot:6207545-Pleurochrysis_carterae.AAC.3